MKTLNALGVLSSDVATGWLVWVDGINGNDALGRRGQMTNPFKSLTAAKDAADIGDTIVVLPGLYLDRNLAKDAVNWHFLSGAVVDNNGQGTLFDVTGDYYFSVTGDAQLKCTGTSKYILNVTGSFAQVVFTCSKMTSQDPCVRITSGTSVTVQANAATSSNNICVDISGGTNKLRIRDIVSNSNYAAQLAGGTNEVEAFRISSGGSKAVRCTTGTSTIVCYEIVSSVDHGVDYDSTTAAILNIVRARIITNATTSGKCGVYITQGQVAAPASLRLHRCTILGSSASTYSINAQSSGKLIGLYGECLANLNLNSTNVISQVSTTLKVDTTNLK